MGGGWVSGPPWVILWGACRVMVPKGWAGCLSPHMGAGIMQKAGVCVWVPDGLHMAGVHTGPSWDFLKYAEASGILGSSLYASFGVLGPPEHSDDF